MKLRITSNMFLILFLTAVIGSSEISAQWNKALHFTWQEHDRVVVPDAPNLWPFVINAGTVEMWFKPDSVLKADTHDPDYTYLFCKNVSGNVEGDMGLCWKRGEGEMQCFIQDGNVTQDVYPDIPIWEPRWYHVAFVWDVDDTMRVFIDGVKSADVEPNEEGEVCIPVYGGTQQIVIGSGAVNLLDDRYETFRGTIDEVRVSAIARYKEDFVPHSTPHEMDAYTIALWHFDEGEGTVASDASGNGFTGTLGSLDSANYAIPEWVKVEKDLKLALNEMLADPASDDSNTDIVEGDANGDGVREPQDDEFVELVNITTAPLDLTGWMVGDDEKVAWRFPDGYVLQPYEFLTIFGGGDVSNVPGYNSDPLQTRVFSTADSVGNGLANSGDYFVILSPDGNHDMYFAYGSKYGAGAPTASFLSDVTWEFEFETQTAANNNNSITRYPDLNFDVEDPWVEHNTVSDADFSPNATYDGSTELAFTISVNIVGNGNVTVDPAQESYSYGDIVTLTATPDDKYVFTGWSGFEETTTNPYSISISGNVNLTAEFVNQFAVTPTLIVNEYLADPASDPVNGDANGDGVREAAQDEFVELLNIGEEAIDMTGWQAGDDEDISFTFPDGYVISPGEFCVIFGGGDVSNVPGYNADPLQTKVFISDSVGVGNGLANGGDFFILKSPDGSYDLYLGYGSKYNAGGPTADIVADIDFEIRIETSAASSNDNSVTRNPDGDISIGDPFVEHVSISEANFSPGTTIDGNTVVSVDESQVQVPEEYSLGQNYPNPFNPSTEIKFSMPENGVVSLKVYNLLGSEIKTLTRGNFSAGTHSVIWDGTNEQGISVSTGVYIYRLEVNNFIQTNKMMFLK